MNENQTLTQILAENLLEKESIKILVSPTYGFRQYTRAFGNLNIDTSKLNPNQVYKCCVEYAEIKNRASSLSSSSSSSLCSYLKFNQNDKPNESAKMNFYDDDASFFTLKNDKLKAQQEEQLFKIERIVEQSTNLYKLSLNALLFCVCLIFTTCLGVLLIMKFTQCMRTCKIRKQQREQQLQQQRLVENSMYRIRMPEYINHQAHHNNNVELYDDLYVRYNLITGNDCSEFVQPVQPPPPAYDDELCQQKQPQKQRF